MNAVRDESPPRYRLFVATVAMAVASLAAFGLLLDHRYLPENFQVASALPYTVEFPWFVAALVTVACGLVIFLRKNWLWRDAVRAALPLAASSLLVLARSLLRVPIQTYDMMLFAVAAGWTTWLWLEKNGILASQQFARALRIGVWSAAILLAGYQFYLQVRYLNDLALGYADCGENARLMFNTMTNPRELFLRVNPNKPLFYDHFYPGILPFMPLWLLWPDLKLTIALQIVAVFGVVVPLYFVGKRAFCDEMSPLLLVAAWLLYPSTSQFVYSASYGFRWGNMCLLFTSLRWHFG